MAWKPTGRPTLRQQREKWVVRVDGIDTESGKHRPRQLGTFTSRSERAGAASPPWTSRQRTVCSAHTSLT